MRRTTILNAGLLLGALLVFGTGGFAAFAGGEGNPERRSVFAQAIVTGPDGVSGVVEFSQPACPGCPTPGLTAPADDPGFESFPEPTVDVTARITGLTPGAHGLHIHETAACVAPGFTTAGGHFDPGPFGSSNPVDANHPYHMGDLPNVVANKRGLGRLKHTTSRITLSPGPLSVFDADGSAVIVHLNPDRGINGAVGASGGARVACGVIQAESN